jgi:hypothetical protein
MAKHLGVEILTALGIDVEFLAAATIRIDHRKLIHVEADYVVLPNQSLDVSGIQHVVKNYTLTENDVDTHPPQDSE